jgi:hypothetical protein
MLKGDELVNPSSCFNKADNFEPIFVLRAKDICAPAAVVTWANSAKGHHEPEKIEEALRLAIQMAEWRHRNVSRPA